jgi:hypothetical protein
MNERWGVSFCGIPEIQRLASSDLMRPFDPLPRVGQDLIDRLRQDDRSSWGGAQVSKSWDLAIEAGETKRISSIAKGNTIEASRLNRILPRDEKQNKKRAQHSRDHRFRDVGGSNNAIQYRILRA